MWGSGEEEVGVRERKLLLRKYRNEQQGAVVAGRGSGDVGMGLREKVGRSGDVGRGHREKSSFA